MFESYLSFIAAGFALGLLHALDADHVMAMTAMSSQKIRWWRTLRLCLHWALGHGGVLLLLGVLLFGFGFEIHPRIQYFAELAVGVSLMLIGCVCLWRFRQQNIRLVEHQHGDITHTHLKIESPSGGQTESGLGRSRLSVDDNHSSVMIGMLHGLAGSAPALALVPVVGVGELVPALLYLSVFSLGVLISMVLFGLGLSGAQSRLQRFSVRIFAWHRYLIAFGSFFLGGFWLVRLL